MSKSRIFHPLWLPLLSRTRFWIFWFASMAFLKNPFAKSIIAANTFFVNQLVSGNIISLADKLISLWYNNTMEILITDCDIRREQYDFLVIVPDGQPVVLHISPFALQKISDFAYRYKILPIKTVTKILNVATERKKINDRQNETGRA